MKGSGVLGESRVGAGDAMGEKDGSSGEDVKSSSSSFLVANTLQEKQSIKNKEDTMGSVGKRKTYSSRQEERFHP